jgi:hypothetical protein
VESLQKYLQIYDCKVLNFLQNCKLGFVYSGIRYRVIEYLDPYISGQRRVLTSKVRRSGLVYPVKQPHAPEKWNPPITSVRFQINDDHFYNLFVVVKERW